MNEETTQLSGLTDYELELEKVIDLILTEPSTLKRIGILGDYIENGFPQEEEKPEWYLEIQTNFIWKPKGPDHFQSNGTHTIRKREDIMDGVELGYLVPYNPAK